MDKEIEDFNKDFDDEIFDMAFVLKRSCCKYNKIPGINIILYLFQL